jgi:hypothetical protein
MSQRQYIAHDGFVLESGSVVVLNPQDGTLGKGKWTAEQVARLLNKAYQSGRYDLADENYDRAAQDRRAAWEAQS